MSSRAGSRSCVKPKLFKASRCCVRGKRYSGLVCTYVFTVLGTVMYRVFLVTWHPNSMGKQIFEFLSPRMSPDVNGVVKSTENFSKHLAEFKPSPLVLVLVQWLVESRHSKTHKMAQDLQPAQYILSTKTFSVKFHTNVLVSRIRTSKVFLPLAFQSAFRLFIDGASGCGRRWA